MRVAKNWVVIPSFDSHGIYFSGNEIVQRDEPQEKLRAHKCLSCGAPLPGMTCAYCGGTHRMGA